MRIAWPRAGSDGHILAQPYMQGPQGALAEGDLHPGGRGTAREQGEEAPAAQLVHSDRRDGLAVHADLPVVSRRVPGHAGLGP